MGWYIVAAVIALLIFLFCIPLRFRWKSDETSEMVLSWLFFHRDLLAPESEKKKRKKAAKTPKETVESKKESLFKQLRELRDILDAHGVPDTLSDLIGLLRSILERLKWLLRQATVDRLHLTVRVGGEDAANTALLYGALCATVYPFESFAESFFRRIRQRDVSILCCYDQPEITGNIDIRIRLPLYKVPKLAIDLLITVLKPYFTARHHHKKEATSHE